MRLEKDKAYIDGIIKANAEKAGYYANKDAAQGSEKGWISGKDPVVVVQRGREYEDTIGGTAEVPGFDPKTGRAGKDCYDRVDQPGVSGLYQLFFLMCGSH